MEAFGSIGSFLGQANDLLGALNEVSGTFQESIGPSDNTENGPRRTSILEMEIQSLKAENDRLRTRNKRLENDAKDKDKRIKELIEITKALGDSAISGKKGTTSTRLSHSVKPARADKFSRNASRSSSSKPTFGAGPSRYGSTSNTSQTAGGERSGQGRPRSSAESGVGKGGDRTSEDKKFTFNEKVEGKNVMVANDLAVVSTGDVPSFLQPLQANQNSVASKNAEIPGMYGKPGLESSPPARLPDVEGSFVGNEKVNVQSNVQQVFLQGSDGGKGSNKKNAYRKADKDELSHFLHKSQDKDAERSEHPTQKPQTATSWEDTDFETKFRTHQLDRIRRLVSLLANDPKSDHFPDLIALLAALSVSQQQSLVPQLGKIACIYLDGCQINYQHLKSFFRLFEYKRYEVLSLRNTRIGAADVHALSSSLGSTCKISCLDLGNCSFGSTVFLDMALLLPSVESVVFSSLTSSRVFSENDSFSTRKFSRKEAQHLSETIAANEEAIDLDLSNCDLRKLEISTALSTSLRKVSKLTLQKCEFTEDTLSVMFGNIQNIRMVDLACSKVRNSGVRAVARYLSRVKVLVLSNVMLDAEGVQPLVDALRSLQKEMDVLDISFNPISDGNVSLLLTTVGKVKAIIFSPEQIKDTSKISNQFGSRQVTLSKVNRGSICRSYGSDPSSWTHWTAYAKTNLENVKRQIEAVTDISPREMESRVVSEFTCVGCKTHIAFTDDVINPSPWQTCCEERRNSTSDPEFDILEPLTHVISCTTKEDPHIMLGLCHSLKCDFEKYNRRLLQCTRCGHEIGKCFFKEQGESFWALERNSQHTLEVGPTRQTDASNSDDDYEDYH